MTERPLNTLQKKRRLPFVMTGNSFNIVFAFLCFFGPVFPLFLDSLELDKKQIGLLMSFMPFYAIIAPFIGATVARFGFKWTFLLFWMLRKAAAALLIAVPWVLARYGAQATFIYLVAAVGLFAICRAAAETAYYPWNQEFVPATIRGKFTAIDQIVMLLIGASAIAVASYVLGDEPAPQRFAWLIAVGVVAGVISGGMYAMVPGGAPVRDQHARGATRYAMGLAIRDKRFMLYMLALTAVLFGASGALPFVPLFMKEQIGLPASRVVQLESAALLAGLASTFLWGWASDRYGGKPVMIAGLSLSVLYPVGLLLMPRGSEWGVVIAFSLAAYVGLVNPGWAIGSSRLLFVDVVPEAHKNGYLCLYYAWIGLVGGIAPIVAGLVLEYTAAWSGQTAMMPIDAYTPLFAAHAALVLVGVVLFSMLDTGGTMGVRRFVGMFFQGNPFAAMQSLVVHNLARNEPDRIASIERLGKAGSPLNVEELVGALSDPNYNVRLEAIVSMARTRPDPRLTEALLGVVRGPEPDIAIAAVWALGRMRDRRAVEVLNDQLLSDYPLLAARSARALAQIGDQQATPNLLARFHDELDPGLRIAYASALGALRHEPALPQILSFLRELDSLSARREMTLAVGRIINGESYLIRLWRRLEPDRATILSEALLANRRRVIRRHGRDRDLTERIDRCIQHLADDELDDGARELAQLIDELPDDAQIESVRQVLADAEHMMQEHGASRIEYLVMALCALEAAYRPRNHAAGR